MNTKIHPVAKHELIEIEDLIWNGGNLKYWEDVLGFELTLDQVTRLTRDDPDYDPDLLLLARSGNEAVGFIMGVRRPWKTGKETLGWVKFIFVHRRYRRQGIGSLLLETIEERMIQQGVKSLVFGSSAPNYALPGIPADLKPSKKFLRANDWWGNSHRENYILKIPKWEKKKRIEPAPPAFSFSPVTHETWEEVFNFIEQSFSRSWALEARSALKGKTRGFGVVARENDSSKIVGFIVINGTNPNWLGPMGVNEPFRHRGLGRGLLEKALQISAEQEQTKLIIPWVNSENAKFYQKTTGAKLHHKFQKFEKELE